VRGQTGNIQNFGVSAFELVGPSSGLNN